MPTHTNMCKHMHITDTHENRKNNEGGEGRGEKHFEAVSHMTRLTLNQMSSLTRAQSVWHMESQVLRAQM